MSAGWKVSFIIICLNLILVDETAAVGGIPYTKEEVMKLSFSNTTDNKSLLKAFNFVRNGDKNGSATFH